MDSELNIAVIGSSEFTVPTAAYFATQGHSVRVTSSDAGVYTVREKSSGHCEVRLLPLERERENVPVIVAIGSPAEAAVAINNRADIFQGALVIFAGGGLDGPFELAALLEDVNTVGAVTIANTTGFPVGGSRFGSNITITSLKENLGVGYGGTENPAARDVIQRLFQRPMVTDLVTASLWSTNFVVHPPVMILGATHVHPGTTALFYGEATTSEAVTLMLAVDQERMRILHALGLPHLPLQEYFQKLYGEDEFGGTLAHSIRNFAPFASVKMPESFEHRFLTEDIAGGLGPLRSLGASLAIATPVTNALITLGEQLVGRELTARSNATAERIIRAHQAGKGKRHCDETKR